MSDPIVSPDGKEYWDGSKWQKVNNNSTSNKTLIQDSVVRYENDSEVVKAALEGVAKIIETNQRNSNLQDRTLVVKKTNGREYQEIKKMISDSKPKKPVNKMAIGWFLTFILCLIAVSLVLAEISQTSDALNDSDGDGVSDEYDLFPNDPNEWSDDDRDGVGNNADRCKDTSVGDEVNQDGCSLSQELEVPSISIAMIVSTLLFSGYILRDKKQH